MFMTGPIHHRVAKRWVRTAQIAMLVGAVGVVPIIVLGMPSAAPISVPDLKPAPPKPDPKSQDQEASALPVDSTAIASRFVQVANNPKPKPPENEGESNGKPPPPPPPAMKYLGAIIEPGTRAALMVLDNRQRMLWVGDKVGNVELAAVEPDHVMIKENGVERRLDLAPRSGPVVTAATGASMNPVTNTITSSSTPTQEPTGNNEATEMRERRTREMLDRIRTHDGRTPTR